METYVGQLQLFAFGFTPIDENCWVLCDGRLLSASQYSALFSLIGLSYGGNSNAFAVPNLNQAALFTPSFSQWYIAVTGTYYPERP